MEFNINDTVRVRITPIGKQLLRKNWLDVHAEIWANGGVGYEYREPEEDADGWSEWQLWALMQEFGPHLHLGCQQPFETTIVIPNAELRGDGPASPARRPA